MGEFWGPEKLNSNAFVELVQRIDSRLEVAAILRVLAGVRDVVDVGGGTGFLTQRIAEHAQVTVIEPSVEQRARIPPGITARAGRAEALPLVDLAVDAALATWVLQYCDGPLRAVDEMARVARRCVVIVQASPHNDLVEIYNVEAAIAGLPLADHAWLLSEAAERLRIAGFVTDIEEVTIPVRVGDPRAMADVLSRLHFDGHPRRAEMVAATEPYIRARGATLADNGAMLVGYRRE